MEQTNLFDDLTVEVPPSLAGFRLQRFEVLNWGTFHRQIWSLPLDGENALLTGEIGSGKSTLVDGLVTLLYPYQKITFNQAAGAKGRERNLLSYVRGNYRQAESGALSLRDASSHSVLLAHFRNLGLDESVTLATVYWFQPSGDLERFYVVARCDLSIKADFLDFGPQIKNLRAQLKKTSHVDTYDSFKEYQDAFSLLFGIRNEQAMNLFYQTVSLKSVGDLTEFIRNHMLEVRDFGPEIDRLKQEFDDLDQAHAAVVKARRQRSLLEPIMLLATELAQARSEAKSLSDIKAYLPVFIRHRRQKLLTQEAGRLSQELANQNAIQQEIRSALEQEQTELRRNEIALETDPDGMRQRELDQELERSFDTRERLKLKWDTYIKLSAPLQLAPPSHLEIFSDNRQLLSDKVNLTREALAAGEAQDRELLQQLQPLNQSQDQLQYELASLARRKTQVPEKHLAFRQLLSDAIGIPTSELPFVAELLRVKEVEKAWTGAIERFLHSFALSLIVPEPHYPAVSDWVEHNQVKLHLVYYKVPDYSPLTVPDLAQDALFCKLEFKQHPQANWVQTEILQRYNLSCCENLADFRRERDALSLAGQIKRGGRRHEKDDRHQIQDASNYVLGWTNRVKIQALQSELQRVSEQIQALNQQQEVWRQQRKQLETQREKIQHLLHLDRFEDLDYHGIQASIERLQRQLQELERASDRLQHLSSLVSKGRRKVSTLSKDLESILKNCALLQHRSEQITQELEQLQGAEAELVTGLEAAIQAFCQEEPDSLDALKRMEISLQARLDKDENSCRQWIQKALSALVAAIGAWKQAFSAESSEVALSEESVPELQAIYQQLLSEDLPRFEARFKDMLQRETLNSLLIFKNDLDEASKDIKRKIARINTSLYEIDYQPGSFIELQMLGQSDTLLVKFRDDLKACLEQKNEGDVYSEARFQEVKSLIDQLTGRTSDFLANPEAGRRWRSKVTDVRQWHSYSALEKRREDGSVLEHYRDSGGKSGGQKEKLAYTILASALAFQFGLSREQGASRSFRFVVIDEAFGKGSDESTRYALNLFKQFQLQLLVVTPKTKVGVITPFVKTILYVHNQDGQRSSVSPLTIAELESLRAEEA